MLRLRKILLYDYIYYIVFFLVIISVYYRINNIEYKLDNNKSFEGIITDINIDDLGLNIVIKNNKEKIKGTYYFNDEQEKNIFSKTYSLGDKIYIKGNIKKISKSTVPYIFDYSNYMKSKKIFYSIKIESYKKIKDNINIFYKIKSIIITRIDKYKNKDYLYAFILGNSSKIEIKDVYQNLGISHLFAISGMHITLLSSIILKVFKKIKFKEFSRYILTSLFIVFYLFLVGFCPSSLRSGIFFILLLINKYWYFNIKTSNILVLTISIILINNPYLIYNTGFLFSATITYFLIVFGDIINKRKSYIPKLFMTSFISFIVSFPITISNYYKINILSIFYNLVFVPLISVIIFPLSLLSIMFNVIDNPLYYLINIVEKLALVLNQFNINLYFKKPEIIFIFFYYLTIFLYLRFKKKFLVVAIIFLITFEYNINIIFPSTYVIMIDVGQGDSILIHNKNKNILIDTGGEVSYYENTYSIVENKTIPLLRSLGIRKLDYLILTHGDNDHMGEAINLVNGFKIDKVIFNVGEYNYLENKLINELENKNIKYYQNIKKLVINNNIYNFINTKDYKNENNNSNVIYVKLNKYKFLFMGDAGIEKENDIIKEYNISNIDFFKVGHHGSDTSSSKEFIDVINPKYSLISVGENNKYGHPMQSVLNTLNNSKIYRTDEDGSIEIRLNKKDYKIKTSTP